MSAPGPSMLSAFVTLSWVATKIVWPFKDGSNWITSPHAAALMVARNEPAPVSALVVTIRVLAELDTHESATAKRQRNALTLLFLSNVLDVADDAVIDSVAFGVQSAVVMPARVTVSVEGFADDRADQVRIAI